MNDLILIKPEKLEEGALTGGVAHTQLFVLAEKSSKQ